MLRSAPPCAGVVMLLLSSMAAQAAVRDVETSPDLARWGASIAASPESRRLHEERLLALLQQGDDALALAQVRSLAPKQPALAAELHETLAGVYFRERRLFRATQHLDAIPTARRTDQSVYLAAHVAARQQRLEAAVALLDQLARRLPQDPLVARDEAQIASLLGRHAQAAAACERVLRQRSAEAEATLLLARMRALQGHMTESERLLAGLFAREPRNGRAALQLGLVQVALGKPEAARESFGRARAIEARNATPYVAEAAVALLLGQRAAARTVVAGALKQNPADPMAGLLDVLSRDGAWPPPVPGSPRFIAAAVYPDLGAEPMPTSIVAELDAPAVAGRIAVANVLLDLVSPQVALDWLASEPGGAGGPLVELTAIRAQLGAGQLQAAGARLAALERSAAARGLVGPAVQAAVLAARQNDPAAARAAMERAIRLAPGSPRVRMLAGDLHLVLGDPARAVPEYRAALAHWPRDPRVLNQLAHALAQVGSQREREEALAHAEMALGQQPHYLLRAALLDTRADLLFRLGRFREALAAYRELSTTVAGITAPQQWHRLGDLAHAAGQAAQARTAYEEALDYGREYPGRAVAIERLDAPLASRAQQ